MFYRFKHFLRFIFSKKYRSVIKQIRLDCHLAILREMLPRVDSNYNVYLYDNFGVRNGK